jgi:hypothetical protein
MKTNLLYILIAISLNSFAQTKMITKAGKITFEASVPAFEEVKAKNESVTFVLNPTSGEIASLALIKGFRFKVALMEEHFNENYMESDSYPKATFKGKIVKYDQKSGVYDVEGDLTIHGVTNKVKTKMNVATTDAKVTVSGSFTVSLKNYKLEIEIMKSV